MYCPHCGTQNDDNSMFCMECGTPLGQTQTSPADGISEMDGQQEIPLNNIEDSPETEERQASYYQQEEHEQGNFGETGYEQGSPYESNRYGYAPNNQFEQNDYGQNPYAENQFVQQPQAREMRPRVKAPRKPVSKAALVIGAQVVLAAGLLVGSYSVMNKKMDPETIAMEYWEATVDHNWSEAYDYCDFPESEMLRKQMYVNAKTTDSDKLQIKSSAIREQRSAEDMISSSQLSKLLGEEQKDALSEAASDMKYYVVEYLTKGSSSKEYSTVVLTKTGKKQYLFWDEWKVAPSESWGTGIQFTIPQGASLTLNGQKASGTAEDQEDGTQIITIPYLFTGNYQMEVSAEGMEPFRKNVEIESYGCDTDYVQLHSSEEVKTSLAEQCGSDIKSLVENGLLGKSFSEVQGLFTEEALKEEYNKKNYDSLKELKDNGRDQGIVNLPLNNIKARVVDDNGTQIRLLVASDMEETYRSYWGNGLETNTETIELNVYYQKEDGDWKLREMPLSQYTF